MYELKYPIEFLNFAHRISKLPLDREIKVNEYNRSKRINLTIGAKRITNDDVQMHVVERVNSKKIDGNHEAVNYLKKRMQLLIRNKQILISDHTVDFQNLILEYWFVIPLRTINDLAFLINVLEASTE